MSAGRILVSDGYGVYCQWVHGRQTCLAHLIRRARGLSERQDPELAGFGRRVLTELQRLVHWAQAPPTAGAVQTWYARMVQLLNQSRTRQDDAGKFARTLEREMASLWTFVVEEGVDPTNNRAERALRFAVLWRRMMHGSYNEKGARWAERLLPAGDVSLAGPADLPCAGGRRDMRFQWPATGCLLDLKTSTP